MESWIPELCLFFWTVGRQSFGTRAYAKSIHESSILVTEHNHCFPLAGLPVARLEFRKSISILFFPLDMCPKLNEEGRLIYMSLVRQSQWLISLGWLDIACAIMTMSLFRRGTEPKRLYPS